jgi:2,4-dichlorophenol 6-monooxygenase
MRLEFQAQAIELGFYYPTGAFVPDGTSPPAVNPDGTEYMQTATPGHRFPHAWLTNAGARVSTLDLVGHGRFVHFTAAAGSHWNQWLAEHAEACDLPLSVLVVDAHCDLQDESGDWLRLCGIEPSGAVLVRPDGYVAWRCRTRGGNSDTAALLRALTTILRPERDCSREAYGESSQSGPRAR